MGALRGAGWWRGSARGLFRFTVAVRSGVYCNSDCSVIRDPTPKEGIYKRSPAHERRIFAVGGASSGRQPPIALGL